MAGLSKLKVGVDVPWVTSWSEEVPVGIRPCPSVGGRPAIFQAERPGLGRPQYSKNHLQRQRRSVAEMLCPMCGTSTSSDDRWTQTGKRIAAGVLRARGLGALLPAALADKQIVVNAGSISPCHLACAERALTHCPHLSAEPDAEIIRFPDAWAVTPLFVEAAPTKPQHLLAAPRAPIAVVSFLQLLGITDQIDPGWRRAAR